MAARSACATAGDAGGRIAHRPVASSSVVAVLRQGLAESGYEDAISRSSSDGRTVDSIAYWRWPLTWLRTA